MSKKPQVVETVTQIKTLIRDNYFNLNCCKRVLALYTILPTAYIDLWT